MIFEFKKNQLNLIKFLEYNVPKIVNDTVQNLWDVHTNKISYATLQQFLNGTCNDANAIWYSIMYLKNNGSKELESEYICSLFDDNVFEPFTLLVKCVYNKKFLDITSNNDVYDRLIRNLVNLTFEDDVIESGKYVMELINETTHTVYPITRKGIYDILRTTVRDRITPYDCIKDYDEMIIEFAEEKFKTENLQHDIESIS